jgi:hypothetical protein
MSESRVINRNRTTLEIASVKEKPAAVVIKDYITYKLLTQILLNRRSEYKKALID